MNTNDTQELFVEALSKRIPKKSKLADFIAETLCIEKESAYRRLRGDVSFTLREAGLIAGKMNLSFDGIVRYTKPKVSRAVVMNMDIDYDMINNGYESIENAVVFLQSLTVQPYSEFGAALSTITLSLYAPYNLLARFFTFKYYRIYGGKHSNIPFSQTAISERGVQLMQQIGYDVRNISYTYYIWNQSIISEIIEDIRYYTSIHAITMEEKLAIKAELFHFLDDLEKVVGNGAHLETGNKVEFYLSNINIRNTYSYMWCENFYLSMITTFVISAMVSVEESTLIKTRNWIDSLKVSSTLISGVSTIARIQFFEKQRELVDKL